MPFINLIAEQRLAAKKEEQKTRLFFMTFASTAALSAAAFAFFFFKAQGLEAEESRLKAEALKAVPLIQKIDENKAKYLALAPRLQTLEDAQKTTQRWHNVLTHVSKVMPNNNWLTALRANTPDPAKPIGISFVGLSANNDLVGELMLRLQTSPDLENVELKFTQEKLITNFRLIEYQIEAGLAGTAEKPKDEGKKEE